MLRLHQAAPIGQYVVEIVKQPPVRRPLPPFCGGERGTELTVNGLALGLRKPIAS